MPNPSSAAARKKFLLATIDLGAHSCRMLLAECDPKTQTPEILEDLAVSVPLGSDVFRHGEISGESIRMLCGIFTNFRQKMDEYGVRQYRAIATSAVREASNAEILIERIRHATGIELKLFDGTDEARLNYLTVMHVLPRNFAFYKKSTLIADIGTGACQISAYVGGSFCFTETIKLGTLRVLDQMPGAMSAEGIRNFLTPIINKTFQELNQNTPVVKSRYIIAMGSSVRTLLSLFGVAGEGEAIWKISRTVFERQLAEIGSMSLDNLSDRYGVPQDQAETVIPCSLIVENLFRISGATTLLVPVVSMKHELLLDFMNETLKIEDGFSRQIEEMVRRTAEKYRSDADCIRRTALFADKLFIQLTGLHGCTVRDALLLRIAALLHKTGLFINNQSYHKHSCYIIRSTEIPGISPAERNIAALVARFHRKTPPEPGDPELAGLSPEQRSTVLKLSAILRLACGLADACRSVTQFHLKAEKSRVVLEPSRELQMAVFSIPEQDVTFFNSVFAVELSVK